MSLSGLRLLEFGIDKWIENKYRGWGLLIDCGPHWENRESYGIQIMVTLDI